MTEVWVNDKGNELEVDWDQLQDSCFYRTYPWTDKKNPRMWQGYATTTDFLSKGYSYVKNLG